MGVAAEWNACPPPQGGYLNRNRVLTENRQVKLAQLFLPFTLATD
jgi:hypothetical protein